MKDTETIHANALNVNGQGILLLGGSGSGKSDLSLRLMDEGAQLIADDHVILTVEAGKLIAHCPEAIRQKIEVRGLGILDLAPEKCTESVTLTRAFYLVSPDEIERLPEEEIFFEAQGIRITAHQLTPFEASATAKIRVALSVL
ncbi:MAG: HPr kinase/phosphorylase [Alphaproteobacteria bacterium]